MQRNDFYLVSAFTAEPYASTLGRYVTKDAAMKCVDEIAWAIDRGAKIYRMPSSLFDQPTEKVMDSRVKRRGGS